MPETRPYLSLVAAARNDDHGGNLLRRLQTFVNGFIGQCRRHDLAAELLLVEWNPPPDRLPLARALCWPADTRPCRVRVITVPDGIHQRYQHAEDLPLYQMIAKNVGIRRAAGKFILATNIDILFSDELIRFLAEGRLERGKMYRIDRHDVASDVPVDGSVEEQLAYCCSHFVRLNAREGSFHLTPDGLRAISQDDIADVASGIHFGAGWYPPQRYGSDTTYRWVGNDAELLVRQPAPTDHVLSLELEPGPSAGREPFLLQVLDSQGTTVAEAVIAGSRTVHFGLPPSPQPLALFRLHVVGGGLPVVNDPHVLNFRVNRCAWAPAAAAQLPAISETGSFAASRDFTGVAPQAGARLPAAPQPVAVFDIVDSAEGLALGKGWYPPESDKDGFFRWAWETAELVVATPPGPPRLLTTKIQPGPAVGFRPSRLCIRDEAGRLVASALVEKLKAVELCLPWRPGRLQVLSLSLESDGAPAPVASDTRTLRFRAFRMSWKGATAAHASSNGRVSEDVPGVEQGLHWGRGWGPPETGPDREIFRRGAGGAEIAVAVPETGAQTLRLDLEPDGAASAPLDLQVRNLDGCMLARGRIRQRQGLYLPLSLRPGQTHVLTLHAQFAGSDPAAAGQTTSFRLFRCAWVECPADVVHPASGLAAGAGWSGVESEEAEIFRFLQNGAELHCRVPGGTNRIVEMEVAPQRAGLPVTLAVRSRSGLLIASLYVLARQTVQFALPEAEEESRVLTLGLESYGSPEPELRVFGCRWASTGRARSTTESLAAAGDILGSGSDVMLGSGWYPVERRNGLCYRWASNGSEVITRGRASGVLTLDLEPGPSAGGKPVLFQLLNSAGQAAYAITLPRNRQVLHISLADLHEPVCVYRLYAHGADLPLPDDPRTLSFQVFACSWSPADSLGQETLSPASPGATDIICPDDLHTHACGDFTLMAREHWLDLRGYPEFDLFSMHLDSVFCFAAHYGGAREEMLRDPFRIYHIEHATGSGWTPEGQEALFARLRAKGITCLDHREVYAWATQMRRLNAPMIFNREDWGLAGEDLPETTL